MKRIKIGSRVIHNDREWTVLDIPKIDLALLKDFVTGHVMQVDPMSCRLVLPKRNTQKNIRTLGEDHWEEANVRYLAIKPLLDLPEAKRTLKAVDEVAAQIGKSRITVYRWLKNWEANPSFLSLMHAPRGDKGKGRISTALEAIIQVHIENDFLKKEKLSVAELLNLIVASCKKQGLQPPSLSAVNARVQRLTAYNVVARRIGTKTARETFQPIRGSFPGADFPLAVYQIDHSPVDVILVSDDELRQPIGRPYLTIVVDTCTRMIVGYYLTLEHPSAMSAGMALAHAILPKDDWLREKGIKESWPIYGIPQKIFADNAKEFRGTMLKRACQAYGIVMENRPRGLPNYGGHVERLFRTVMKKTHTLPGTTFSNVQQRVEYDSAKRAILTLEEFDRWFGNFVVLVYNRRRNRGIGRETPLNLYMKYILGDGPDKIGIGLPPRIEDPEKLRYDFMPFIERTIQRDGVVIDNIRYAGDATHSWAYTHTLGDRSKKKYIFARDPRDISRVYFFDPALNRYQPLGYRNVSHPPMSIWELNEIKKKIPKNNQSQEELEVAIFEGLERMRQIVDTSKQRTMSAKRKHERKKAWSAIQKNTHTTTNKKVTRAAVADTPQIQDEWPFDTEDLQPLKYRGAE